jgi:hypothetical protein
LRSSSDGVPGVQPMPFAGLLPRPGGHATLASRGGRERTVVLALRHFCRSGPTCRSVPLRPPRLIFVGVTDRLLEFTEICKSDRPRMRMASTSGLQLPSAVRVPGARLAENACLPWALPLAGLSGTFRRASAGLDPGFDHQPPEPSTGPHSPRRFLSAHGLATRPSRHASDRRCGELLAVLRSSVTAKG